MGNLGVVPLFLAKRFLALPFRALRILRAVLLFIRRDGINLLQKLSSTSS